MQPLFSDTADYEVFLADMQKQRYKEPTLFSQGSGLFGIDAGSTTTKLVLINGNGELLYEDYGSNEGRPLSVAVSALKKVYDSLSKDSYIAYAGVTGYGEKMVQTALKADMGEVETVAHYRAAEPFLPGAAFVIDIGGRT